MAATYIIRPYRETDAPAVHSVRRATYGKGAPPAEAGEWWSFGSPEITSGFMVAEADSKVVGAQPMELFRFVDGSETVLGGLLTGVVVHPEFRRQGIFLALVQACEAEAWRQGAAFVTTMPNDRSRPGFLKMGYTDLGRRRFLVRPLDCRALSRAAVRVPGLDWLTGGLAQVVQSVAKPVSHDDGLVFRETRELPAGLGEIERQHTGLFPGLRVRRTTAWWQWRYLTSPLRHYRLIEARTPSGEAVGLAASCDEVRGGLKIAYLMDVAVSDRRALPGLVASVIRVAESGGAAAVGAVTSSPELMRAVCRAGFWEIPLWAPIKRFYSVVRFNPSGVGSVPVRWKRIDGWYQTLGDWDNL